MFKERLAELLHKNMQGFLLFLFAASKSNEDGTYTIPVAIVGHLKKVQYSRYDELNLRDQDFHRVEADGVIDLMSKTNNNDKRDAEWRWIGKG